MSATAAFTYAQTVLRYFNPSRSPFYAIIAIGTISLDYAYDGLEGTRWHIVAGIIMAVLGIATWISLTDRATMSKEEYVDQLYFSRSICVSAALMALTYFSVGYQDELRFNVVLVMSIVQTLTFLLYIWARKDSPQELTDTNYVQLALITTTFFLGAMNLLQTPASGVEDQGIEWKQTLSENFPSLYLSILWLTCIRVWWQLIRKLVIILERRPEKSNTSPAS